MNSVGIFHYDPLSASEHLINIWNDIEYWWFSDKVQKIRNEFCMNYGYRDSNINLGIANILNNINK